MADLTQNAGRVYACKSCGVQFIIPEDESAVCCPVCRMNRIEVSE